LAAAILCLAQPAARAQLAGTMGSTDTQGWTPLNPSNDSRIVYVSSSGGNDSNSGLASSAPVRTLTHGFNLLRDGYPDWLMLKCGDAWSGESLYWTKGGRSATEMMRLGSYGTGERPLIMTGRNDGLNNIGPHAHLAITDVHFLADGNDGSATNSGITLMNGWSNVLIENVMIERYLCNIAFQNYPTLRLSDIKVRRCIIVDAYTTTQQHAQGLLAGATDGLLIEECVFDHNGLNNDGSGSPTSGFSCGMYLQVGNTGVVTRGNIVSRQGGEGISQRCGGVCENNLILQNPMNIQFGSVNVPTATGGAIRNNVVLDSHDIDPANQRGIGMTIYDAVGLEVAGNIVAHQRTGTGNIYGINFGTYSGGSIQSRYISVHDNVVYDWTLPDGTTYEGSIGLMIGPAAGSNNITVRNNDFQGPRGGFLVALSGITASVFGPVTFTGNRYYTTNLAPHQIYYTTTYPQWEGDSGETGASYGALSYPDPERCVGTYMAAMGAPATLGTFAALARRQSRTNWSDRFTAAAVNDYIRAGFGRAAVNPCVLDVNGDGSFNVNDVMMLMSLIQTGDLRADLNHDGVVNISDIQVFQWAMPQGCQ
jgi:hypothetical protein